MALKHLSKESTPAISLDDPAQMTQQTRPVYLKLRDLIAAAIIEGAYKEGEMLPSVRAFAAAQGANPLTVAKAYQQFQTDGLVEVQRGVGMYVVQGAAAKLRNAEREQFIAQEWPEIEARMKRLGIDPVKLLEIADA
jgi:GntR family transcriptional regulator